MTLLKCGSCKWFILAPTKDISNVGLCHGNTPQIILSPQGPISVWPIVSEQTPGCRYGEETLILELPPERLAS